MKSGLTTIALVFALGAVQAAPAWADDLARSCSLRSIAGRWLFATDVGQRPVLGGDITALGTMNIDKEGNVSGEFDFTVAQFGSFSDVSYTGSITVDADCTGTLTFTTGVGTSRTDSIAIVDRKEMWGMSRDPANLWNYKVRRIGGPAR